jgi:hypothetical protein
LNAKGAPVRSRVLSGRREDEAGGEDRQLV